MLERALTASAHGYASRHVWTDADILRRATAESPHGQPRKLLESTCAQGPSTLKATRRAPAFDEENTTSRKQDMEERMESASKVTRESMMIANRMDKPEGSGMDLVMALSDESDARNTTAENSQGSASSNVEELMAYGAPSSSETSRGRKRKLTPTAPDIPMELTLERRTSSTTDIGANLIQRVEELMKVATTSSNLKNTYIKTLKEATSSIAVGTVELIRRTVLVYGTGAARMAEMWLEVLEKEAGILRKEQLGKAGCVTYKRRRFFTTSISTIGFSTVPA